MRCKEIFYLLLLILLSCKKTDKSGRVYVFTKDPLTNDSVSETGYYTTRSKTLYNKKYITNIATGKVSPAAVIAFACSLEGTPYRYGSADPAHGFDCSGFINYVFNHFGIVVPRTSVGFTAVGHDIPLNKAMPGDLVLFTGTDYRMRTVGHIGILISLPDHEPKFVHATSGKEDGVTESTLNSYYLNRYIKTVRVFPTGAFNLYWPVKHLAKGRKKPNIY
ncbi:MAG TPA: C40 family peptidase [Mucilaginibacter sp.]|jgi:cell wall-associated NlpC family hydrolase